MNIKTLQLSNFRSFGEFELNLSEGFNLIIGDNARGKTSLLDSLSLGIGCIFMGFPSPANSREIQIADVRQRFFETGQRITTEHQFPCKIACIGELEGESGRWEIELEAKGGNTRWKNAEWMNARAKNIHTRVKSNDQSQILPVIAHYGTERLWKQLSEKGTQTKTLSPESRFSGYLDCLDPASNEKRLFEWFKTAELTALQQNVSLDVLESCRTAILKCVPDASSVYYDVAFDSLILKIQDQPIPFAHLSDGYRNMLAMVADLAVKCSALNPQLGVNATDSPGVVLIDEIDLHLHPKWQRRVVGDLITAFPNVQFVSTTHSPFVIQSLPPDANVKLINLDGEQLEDIHDRSVEDIAEFLQGVEMPQRSQRHVEMMKTAEAYFKLLEDDSDASDEFKQAKREELQQAIQMHADNPAYQALIRMKELAGDAKQENGRFHGRGRKVVEPDERNKDSDGGGS